MRGILCSVVAAAAALSLSGGAFASGINILEFDESTGSTGVNNDQSVGWQFDVLDTILVNGLQWYDDGQDGLSVDHEVGIWDPAGVLLGSVVIPAGTAAPLNGVYRTIKLAEPIELTPATGYIVGGYNGSASTDRLAFNVDQVTHPSIRYIDATFSDINGIFERPTNFSAADTGFYGPSFQIVPAPGAVALLGIAGLAARRRRRA